MAKRKFGVERLFNLGSFKNVRVIEQVEIDDDQYTEDEISGMRMLLLLRTYEVFAKNKVLMCGLAEAQNEYGHDLTGEEILDIVQTLIEDIENDMEVVKDA